MKGFFFLLSELTDSALTHTHMKTIMKGLLMNACHATSCTQYIALDTESTTQIASEMRIRTNTNLTALS